MTTSSDLMLMITKIASMAFWARDINYCLLSTQSGQSFSFKSRWMVITTQHTHQQPFPYQAGSKSSNYLNEILPLYHCILLMLFCSLELHTWSLNLATIMFPLYFIPSLSPFPVLSPFREQNPDPWFLLEEEQKTIKTNNHREEIRKSWE